MNSFIVKLFIFMNEVLSGIIIFFTLMTGIILMVSGSFAIGLAVSIIGTLIVTSLFGFGAIFIEIHKDLRFIKDKSENNNI